MLAQLLSMQEVGIDLFWEKKTVGLFSLSQQEGNRQGNLYSLLSQSLLLPTLPADGYI